MPAPILIAGRWTESAGSETFQATNPATTQPIGQHYPVSTWDDVDRALDAAVDAFHTVRDWSGHRFASFLDAFAGAIEQRKDAIVQAAHEETALPLNPRLADVEFPRTVNQLRTAADCARDASWALPTVDTQANISSIYMAIGPVVLFSPNNFPLAFNPMAGGDFAAAVAAGNPVIAKGHPLHPRTTQLFAEAAREVAENADMPSGFIQLIYHMDNADGLRLAGDPRVGAVAFTGSMRGGLALKEAADRAGKPIYLEMSSINPVFMLPGALEERLDAIVEDLTTSCLMAAGQFCTNPGLVVLPAGDLGEQFAQKLAATFDDRPMGTMLSGDVVEGFNTSVATLESAGAKRLTSKTTADNGRYCAPNTVLQISADEFLRDPETFRTEAFGNATLLVMARDVEQMEQIAQAMEGNLTGCLYSATDGRDDDAYDHIAPAVRQKVGRLLNDKMPTGVAVSPAMNHGGPFPATGHPGFTAIGLPASLRRFAMLKCFDNVRPHRLPAPLRGPGE